MSVVVRNSPLARFVGAPLAAIVGVGCWVALIEAIAHGDAGWPFRGSGLSGGGIVFGWVLTGLALVATTWFAPFSVLFRETFDESGVTVRRLVASSRLDLAEMTSIRTTRAAVRTGQRVLPFTRLVISGAAGAGARAILDASMTGSREALPVVSGWARSRPDLVADDETRAALDAD